MNKSEILKDLNWIKENYVMKEKGGLKTAQIQKTNSEFGKRINKILHEIMPGQLDNLSIGLPWDMATSVCAVPINYGGMEVLIGQKNERFDRDAYCLAPAGWFDNRVDKNIMDTLRREAFEELNLNIDETKVYYLGNFFHVRTFDSRKADFPSNAFGVVLDDMDEHDWSGFESSEIKNLKWYNQKEFEYLVSKDKMLYDDQVYFVKKYFENYKYNTYDLPLLTNVINA